MATFPDATAVPALRPKIRYAVESIGAFSLVFTVGAAESGGSPIPPLALGAVLMVMIYAEAYRSGGHYSPATTMLALVRGRIGLRDAAGYWIAQLSAGLLAVVAVTMTGHTPAAASMVELVFTFVLCYVALDAATRSPPDNSFCGLAIGFIVVAGTFAGNAISGGAFHPAVTVAAGAGTAAGFALLTLNPPTHDPAPPE
ncbi:aquaporin [Rhodococcus wratislaviensis]|uniref:Porin n=1 Tax=Rhodococcus wratislaviensis NBRC 100605 TaxID=1219028 RepID=X0QAJ6_RHOWR|nr:aquaporin [Rhodococcus wratislaviensis]GAF48607.1 hypothetical protein RW1_056_00350 [Rhodococcus wratislaviensis NBRC 100605]